MDSNIVNKSIEVHAPAAAVWKVLTEPGLIQQWISDDPLTLDYDWTVGGVLLARGEMHGHSFENKGTVLAFEPGKLLRYTFLSSLSKLPDRPQNYSVIAFTLKPEGAHTLMTLTQTNLVTITNYKHFDFYWNVTLMIIQRLAKEQ